MSYLPEGSDEQIDIIESVANGYNIICNAVPGSGKTTLIMLLAKRLPNKKIMNITYNKALKEEVRRKVINSNINNLEVQTYHSCCQYYYGMGKDDACLNNVINKSQKLIKKSTSIDILVIDENQDMTQLYLLN